MTFTHAVDRSRQLARSSADELRKEAGWRRADRRWGYVFVAPQVIGVGVFILLPFVVGVALSFTTWDGLTAPVWVGFGNFVTEFTDPLLGRAIINNLLLAAITIPIGLGLAVVIAVALEKLRTRTLYLLMIFAPVVTSTIAASMIFSVRTTAIRIASEPKLTAALPCSPNSRS